MIRSFQERQRLRPAAIPVSKIATVAAVSEQTAQLTFSDGTTSHKYYKAMVAVTVGQRVQLKKISGTYVIEAPV